MTFNFNRLTQISALVLLAVSLLSISTFASAHNQDDVNSVVVQATTQEFSARQLSRKCKSLSFNSSAAFRAVKGLKATLKAAGHKNGELSKAALSVSIKELSKRATKLIISKGVVAGEPATYCKVGKAEINANSPIGAMLKAK